MVQVKDLENQIGVMGPKPILYCSVCGAENSANKGDYFAAKPDTILKCCGFPLKLVIKSTRYRYI